MTGRARRSLPGRRWLLLGLALALLGGRPASGRHGHGQPRPGSEPDDAAQKQASLALSAARSALSAHDFAAAGRHAAAALRALPSPEALLLLGRVAQGEGRLLDAQDLFRRYLADPNLELAEGSPEKQEAERLANQPQEAGAQLTILGDRETLVTIDGRLVGALPLSRPLLLSAAEHKVELSRGQRQVEDQIRVPVGRVGELRSDLSTKTLILTILPSVVLLDQYSGLTDGEQLRLAQAVERAVQKERLALLGREVAFAISGEPPPGPCPSSRRCQLDLASKCEADYLLRVQATRQGQSWQLEMALVDGTIGEVAARSTTECRDCTADQASQQLAALFAPLYKDAAKRPRSRLDLRSEPSGAELSLDEQPLGSTPYREPTFGGSRQLLIQKDGYQDARRALTLADGETAELNITLTPQPEPDPAPLLPPPPPRQVWQRQPRPLWRILTGAAVIGAGLLVIGFADSALYYNGRCTSDTSKVQPSPPAAPICPQSYQTGGIGVGLGLLGLGVLGAGVGMIAWPGPQRLVNDSMTVSPGPALTLLRLTY